MYSAVKNSGRDMSVSVFMSVSISVFVSMITYVRLDNCVIDSQDPYKVAAR